MAHKNNHKTFFSRSHHLPWEAFFSFSFLANPLTSSSSPTSFSFTIPFSNCLTSKVFLSFCWNKLTFIFSSLANCFRLESLKLLFIREIRESICNSLELQSYKVDCALEASQNSFTENGEVETAIDQHLKMPQGVQQIFQRLSTINESRRKRIIYERVELFTQATQPLMSYAP